MNPPAFQLYADDFLAGTADMTAEEVGIYIRLLCHSWNKKGLKNDEKRLGILVGQCGGNAMASAMEVLRAKFELGTDGRWRNRRLEEVRAERQKYSETQSHNAHLRWEKVKNTPRPAPASPDATAHAMASPSQCSPSPTPSPNNREREKGDQVVPERHFAEAVVPSWEEVRKMASVSAVPEDVARAFYDHYENNNLWANRHGRPINVRGSLVVWCNRSRTANGNPARQPSKSKLPEQNQLQEVIKPKLL